MSTLDDHPALLFGLEAAVPLEIARVRHWPAGRRQIEAQQAGHAVAERGDALMFGGKRGEAGAVFSQLATGLAILACQPGGVTFAGMHWCAYSHPGCPDLRRRPACCACDSSCAGCKTCPWCRNGCAAASGQACCEGLEPADAGPPPAAARPPAEDVAVAGDLL